MAIVTLEIEVHAFAEQRRAEQRVDHPHHLGALLVDGGGVEVVDLAVELRSYRVGEGTGVLDELAGATPAPVAAPGDDPRALVRGELLVAIDRQAFLQAELEPVAA